MDIIDRLRIEAKREPHEPIWRDAIAEIENKKDVSNIDQWREIMEVLIRDLDAGLLNIRTKQAAKAFDSARALLDREYLFT
jgi:hypothetical protein